MSTDARYNDMQMTNAAPHSRPRRFHVKANPRGFRLDVRKFSLLRELGRNRFMNTEQLAIVDGGSAQKVQRILRTLFDHGLVVRPLAQRVQLAGEENRPIVYSLSHKGAALLAEHDRTPLRDFNWTTKSKRRKAEHILHAVEIANVMRAFSSAVAARRWNLLDHRELIPTFPETTRGEKGTSPFSLRAEIHDAAKDEERFLSVIPDRLFSVRPPGGRINFALEYDTGWMPVFRWKNRKKRILNLDETNIARKMLVYLAAWRTDLHTTRWGFQQFRILFVTESASRISEMNEASHFVTDGKGSRLFAFTDRETLLKNDALGAIWIDGKGEQTDLVR